MAPTRFRHNKKRNSGLLYEFLIRKVTESCIDKNTNSYNTAFNLIKKYFDEGSPLREEKEIFDAVLNNAGKVNKEIARGIVKEVIRESKKVNNRLLEIKKSNLIKEIHKTFGKEFFSNFRIDDYRTYASIQLLINNSKSSSTLIENIDRVQLEDTIVNFLIKEKIVEKNRMSDVDLFTYNIALKKFDDKYNSELNESQKRILKKYIRSFFNKDKSSLNKFINEEISDIADELNFHRNDKCFKEDSEMKTKLNEAINKLDQLSKKPIDDHLVENLMMFRKLIEEISSDA